MRNFKMMVKMMVMAVVFGALFCSCNVAGGSDYSDAASSRASLNGINGGTVNGQGRNVSFSIKLPSVEVSVSGADAAKQSASATTAITAEATEGALLSWYVNGMETGETGSVFQLSCSVPGVYDVTCIAVSADRTLCKSASKCVTVYP